MENGKLVEPAAHSLMDDALWVMNFLRGIEEQGRHAPTETMQRLIDAIGGMQSLQLVSSGWLFPDDDMGQRRWKTVEKFTADAQAALHKNLVKCLKELP